MTITVSPLRQTVNEGGVAVFTATAKGIKTREFKYQWMKMKLNSRQMTVISRKKQLQIKNVTIENRMYSYYCIVTNEWDNTKQSTLVHLTVNGKMH